MADPLSMTETYRRLSCSECGIVYFFPEAWCRRADEASRGWKCPNGHGQMFRESELDRTRRERDRLKQQTARLEQERDEAQRTADRQARALRRVEKRIHRGVCPHCNRTFTDLARHMAGKHPGAPRLIAEAS